MEEEIALLHHKKLISKNLETAEMSLTGVLKAIFETEEEEEEKEETTSVHKTWTVGPKYWRTPMLPRRLDGSTKYLGVSVLPPQQNDTRGK